MPRKYDALKQSIDNAKITQNYPANTTNEFYHGIVTENNDPNGHMRIQVRITSKDFDIKDDSKLKWCIGLTPSFFFCIPQIGEHVIVFLRNPWSHQRGRFYMGPIRSGDSGEPESFGETIKKLKVGKDGL